MVMSGTIIAVIVGAGVGLLIATITIITYAFVDSRRNRERIRQQIFESKREHLRDIYFELISIANTYPTGNPNDVIQNIENVPPYKREGFEEVLETLNYQIQGYENQMKNYNLTYEKQSEVEEQILYRKYVRKELDEIKERYMAAKKKYGQFEEKDKEVFDLYAGHEVRRSLADFNTIINNIFVTGHRAGTDFGFQGNPIVTLRQRLVDSMRKDLGIDYE